MKNLTNTLRKILILVVVFVTAIPTAAFAGMTNDSNLKHYEERYRRQIEELGKTTRGLYPTENLQGTVKEEIKFEKRLHYANDVWKDGVYEVELWNKESSALFECTENDYYYFKYGFFYKNEKGELIQFTFEDFDILLAGTIMDALLGTPLWKDYIKVPDGIGPVNGNEELYGYILYDYVYGVKKFNQDETDQGIYNFVEYDTELKLKLFKFNVNEKRVVPAPVYETATPTASKVIIDGKEIAFDAYNIKGNNYFKLRDLAFAVRDSEKSFNLKWNNQLGIVELDDFMMYYPTGGELAKGDGKVKTATLNTAPTYSNFELKNYTVYNIGGNNYYKLRDICDEFNYDLVWDGAKNSILIDTTKVYIADSKAVTESKPEVKPEVKQEVKPETSTGDISTYINNGNKNVLKKEYARQFDLAVIDNTKCVVNENGLTLTVTAPTLPAELKEFKYNIAITIKALDKEHKVVTIRSNQDLAQGETAAFPFEGDKFTAYTFTSIMFDVATETATMEELQRHIISSDYPTTVFEQNLDGKPTEELSKDLSNILVGIGK